MRVEGYALGARLPRHPVPVGLLRLEARDEGLLRVGADGDFDEQAHSRSYQWRLTKHRNSALAAVTAVAGGTLAAAVMALRR